MTLTASNTGPDRVFRLRDGRRISYAEFGAPDGRPVLALHGTPASRLMYAIAASSAARLGLRLIAPDRWGYAGTDPHPEPSLSAWAQDAAELADGLGLDRFSIIGISGGSPYAAGTAAELGSRVIAMALAVPVGPLVSNGSKRRLPLLQRLSFFWVGQRPSLTKSVFKAYGRFLNRWSRRAVSLAMIGQSRFDRELLRKPPINDYFGEISREGLRAGGAGPAIDLQLFSSEWHVPLDRISAKTRIWIGKDDKLVPLAAARELARAIPGAILTELDDRGHFWIAEEYGQVLDWLAAAGRDEGEVRQ
jgi:pimeloyl-ACP methyl ester carboxylesterase